MVADLMVLGEKLMAAFTDCYQWFFESQSLDDLLSSIPVVSTGLVPWIVEKTDVFEGVIFVPAELVFEWGIPAILGFCIVKWLVNIM